MNVKVIHKLEFHTASPPTIGELFAMLKTAEQNGFPEDTPVQIRAGDDDRDHDYYFYATIGEPDEPRKSVIAREAMKP